MTTKIRHTVHTSIVYSGIFVWCRQPTVTAYKSAENTMLASVSGFDTTRRPTSVGVRIGLRVRTRKPNFIKGLSALRLVQHYSQLTPPVRLPTRNVYNRRRRTEHLYLRQDGFVFVLVCLSVCLSTGLFDKINGQSCCKVSRSEINLFLCVPLPGHRH